VDLAEYRRKSFDIWEKMASGWERNRDFVWEITRPVSMQMLSALEPQTGDKVLELAAGTGETGFAAATMVGSDGRVILTDFAPEMIEAARRRAADLGLENVEMRVMDAESMDLPDDSVDGVLCRFGYMLMADPAVALAETRRVLRDGGRLSFAIWAGPERNPWAAVSGAAMVKHGHLPPPEPGAPGMFSMADEGRIRELVTGAGFGDPEIAEVPVKFRYEDSDEYWRFATELAGALAMAVEGLSEAEREPVRQTMREEAERFRANGGYLMPGVALSVVTS
jgi:ubiquinone/menaquinone biosynthesis C-methylase UbiE